MRSKFRITQHEYMDEHGHMQTIYIPEQRVLFFLWCPFAVGDFGESAVFNSIDEAKRFIADVEHLNGRLQKDTVIEEYV